MRDLPQTIAHHKVVANASQSLEEKTKFSAAMHPNKCCEREQFQRYLQYKRNVIIQRSGCPPPDEIGEMSKGFGAESFTEQFAATL